MTSLRSTYLLNKTQPDVCVAPAKPQTQPSTTPAAAATEKAPTKRRPGCKDWTRWLVAGTVSHICVLICGTVLILHECLCGGLAMCFLVLVPILGPNSLTWGDHADTLTIAGVYLLAGVFIDVIAIIASMKLALRAVLGYLTISFASIAQIGRLVFLLLMIQNGKDLWDEKSALVARSLFMVELVVLVGIIGMYLSSRWRHNEKKALSRQELPMSHVGYTPAGKHFASETTLEEP